MPFYEYECSNCKFYSEVMQKITDPPMTKCPSCGKKTMTKLISAPNFRLKGGGWYETDFKGDKENKRNLAGAEKEESSTERSARESPAGTKPETATERAASESSKTEASKPEASAKADSATADKATKPASTSAGSSSGAEAKSSSTRRGSTAVARSAKPVARAAPPKARPVAASRSTPKSRGKPKPAARKKARR